MPRPLTVLVSLAIALLFVQLVAAAPKSTQPAEPFGDLAGEYYEGTSLYGTLLTLGASGWFRFTTQRDNLARPEKKCKGMFWEWQGTLIFKPTKNIKIDEEWEAPPTRLIPVKWGKRRYLIREKHAQDFCNLVNLGEEPRRFWGAPYLRGEDLRLKVTGPPEVPERWKGLLLATSVSCKVTELLPDHRYRIDAGANRGLKVGMIVNSGKWLEDFAVEAVDGDGAVVKRVYDGSRAVLTVGQPLSTRYSK